MIYARLLLLPLLFAALAGPVHAQQPVSDARDTTETATHRKDPRQAVIYSMSGTILLTPAFGAGLIIGPAFGHLYARDYRQALLGIGSRLGGLLPPAAVWVAAAKDDQTAGPAYGPLLGLSAIAGGVIILQSAIQDIRTANNSAREYNRAHGLQTSGVQMQMAPTLGGPRGTQVGLALRVRF